MTQCEAEATVEVRAGYPKDDGWDYMGCEDWVNRVCVAHVLDSHSWVCGGVSFNGYPTKAEFQLGLPTQ